jgi:hypothetical protein
LEDASSSLVGSFPILSPDHKFDDDDDDGASFFGNNDDAEEEETNATKEDDGTDDADAKKEGGDRDDDDADDDARGAKADDREAAIGARRSRDVDDDDDDADAKGCGNRRVSAADDAHSPPPPTPRSPDDAAAGRLRRRVAEIRSRRDDLARGIAKKALIKGTLITAIDDNLVKSMREMDGTTTYDDGSSRWAARLLRPGWNFNPLAFLLVASASMMRVATWRAHSHCQGCSRTIG